MTRCQYSISPLKRPGVGLNPSTKKTCKRELPDEIERVVPWQAVLHVVEPYCPKAKTGRPSFRIETMLRIYQLQQWFARSDPAMAAVLRDMAVFREFTKLDRERRIDKLERILLLGLSPVTTYELDHSYFNEFQVEP